MDFDAEGNLLVANWGSGFIEVIPCVWDMYLAENLLANSYASTYDIIQ